MSLSPGEPFDIVLDGDKDKEKPLTFHYQTLSRREYRELEKLADKYDEAKGDDRWEIQDQIIGIKLTGWSNLLRDGAEVPFDPKLIDEALTTVQSTELMVKRVRAEQLGPDDRKKSESPAS